MAPIPYICGYIKQTTGDYLDVPSWAPGIVLFRGPLHSTTQPQYYNYAMKPKKDYAGNFWFFAKYNMDPTLLYLVRASLNPDESVSLTYLELRSVLGYTIEPNQLTIDKNGCVYFPHNIPGDLHQGIVKVDPNTGPWTVTTRIWTFNENFAWSACVTLNKDHSMVVCMHQNNQGMGTVLVAYNTSNLVLAGYKVFGSIESVDIPYNMETDVSGGVHDGLGCYIVNKPQSKEIVMFDWSGPPPTQMNIYRTVIDQLNGGDMVAIDTAGKLRTMTHNVTTGVSLNVYDPLAAGLFAIPPSESYPKTCVIYPNHHDLRRSVNDEWMTANCVVVEKLAANPYTETVKHNVPSYDFAGEGCDREAYS